MVESIPPTGMAITQYPPLVRTPETTRMLDLAKAIIDLQASINECKDQFDRMLVPETMFFLAHFGPDPLTSIVQTYFKTPEGKANILTTSEIRQTALEIVERGPPSLLTYKADRILIILTYINKYVKNRQSLERTRVELFELGATSFISMNAPPIPAQIEAVIGSGSFESLKVKSNSPALWSSAKKNITKDLSSLLKLKAGTTLLNALKGKFNYRFNNKVQDYFHPNGYALYPFLIYHSKSMIDNPTSIGYWGHVAKYRLHAYKVSETLSEVRLLEVNPVTGAPFDKGMIAGIYRDEPSNALAAVRKMYPFVLELKSQENVKLSKSIVISDSTSKLKGSAERWALTGKKSERTFVNIIRTTWDWADLDLKGNGSWYSAFNSANKSNKGKRTFKQEQLLGFQSDDVTKRKASMVAGNPPKSINHLVFGGNPEQMRNCLPISVSEFYLLPAGTESALANLCLSTPNNALIRVVNKRLKGTLAKDKSFAMQSQLSKDNFLAELKSINNDMQILKAAISSPYLFTLGYDKLLMGNSLENLGMSASLPCKMRVKKMFEEAKWPRSAGELVFKAPVNDTMDSQVMRGKFIAAMKQAGKVAPSEMSFFEMPNMQIQYTYEVGQKFASPNFEVSPGNGYPFTTKNPSALKSLFRYYDAGKTNAQWKTLYISRELKFAKGVYTNSRDRSTNSDKFTTMTTIPPVPVGIDSGIGRYNFTMDAVKTVSVASAIGLSALGYVAFKRRQLGD